MEPSPVNPLPRIQIQSDGRITAGTLVLEPSSRHWRRRRCWWRCRSTAGTVLTGWRLTPRLALLAAPQSAQANASGK